MERTGVPASTIHHYRRMGLLATGDSVATNRFCYGTEHVEALRVIRQLRERRGLPLDEIADVLPGLMALPQADREDDIRRGDGGDSPGVRRRLLDAAIAAFEVR
ncbi:MAG: MerR family transcriptional regulator, partial [Acidimicrobiales bacterium]